jgi:hypothetical protein
MVIAWTAALAAAISMGLPLLPSLSFAIVIPPLLCVRRLPEGDQGAFTEHPAWYWLVTVFVGWLLDRLLAQTERDRLNWARSKAAEVQDLGDLNMAARHVLTTLSALTQERSGSEQLRHELKAHYDDVVEGVSKAREAKNRYESEEAREAEHGARQALVAMLGLAYNWGYTDISAMPSHERV